MAKDKEVKLILTAEDNISSVVKKVSEYLGETGMGQAVTAVSTSFLAFEKALETVSKALGKVYDQIAAGVNDAALAESVNKRLAMSMASVGEYTDESFNAIQDWAGALETATGVSDEAFRSLVSLGLQQGMTTEQSKKAAEAALNLAAATGQDMNSAFTQMSMTLSGTAGRLEKMIPELRSLTQEELQNGAAIDIIAKKYEGFAENSAQSFTGAMTKLDSQIGNVKESLGRMIAQNPIIISSIEALGEAIGSIAAYAEELSTWVLNNAEDLKILAVSFGIASTVVIAYTAYQNAATIATVATKVATIALNTAMMLTPYGLIIAGVAALTAGFYYLYKNLDLVTGAIKVGLGMAINLVTSQLRSFLSGLAKVVTFFNADWGQALENTAAKIESFSNSMIENGKAQMEAARAAKNGMDQQSTAAMNLSRATAGITNKITEQEQELVKLRGQFSKAAESAKSAFSGLKDLMPRMNLDNFNQDAANWKKSIENLKSQAENLKAKISLGIESEGTKAELEKIEQQIRNANEAEKALKIKTAQETRNVLIQEEKIRLEQLKFNESTAAQEIARMRLAHAQQSRSQLINLEVERLLEQRGLADINEREGITVRQAAQKQANDIELDAFRKRLEIEKALSISIETQKQNELSKIRSSTFSEGSDEALKEKNKIEIAQAQARIAELSRLRQADVISESEYQNQLVEVRIKGMQDSLALEMAMNQEKMELLGTSPEALQAKIEMEKLNNETSLLILREKLSAEMITEEEFRIMKEELETSHLERATQIKEAHLNREIEQNTRLGKNWEATLAKIRLEQEKHGQMMGLIRGIQQSQEYSATQQGLSDLASLRSSSDRKAFELGQAAAIGQSMVNTFMAATSAYAAMSSIPIVGPALGAAAAAAAIAAGMNNISQIKSQKYQGKAHGGIDEVPRSMDNSTFILKAGERVVQPDQNRKLGEAVDKINEGGVGGNTISIVIQGNANEDTVDQIKNAVLDAIRESSERGTPIIHEKGIVKG